MRDIIDLWGDIGGLPDDGALHVLTRLFAFYEAKLENEPENEEYLQFFQFLDTAIIQTCECNSNRR